MLYKPLPMDWINWNPAQMTYEDYAKIVKPDPPLTQDEKNNDALAALMEYDFWKDAIPTKILDLVKTTYPQEFEKAKQLEARAQNIKSHELRRMVLMQAGEILAKLIGMDGPGL